MLAQEDLETLLHDLESDRVERTISATKTDKFAEAICAFANDFPNHRQPGYLMLGVNHEGTLSGLEVTDELLKNLAGIRADGNVQPLPAMTVPSGTRLSKLSISGNNYAFATLNSRLWGALRDLDYKESPDDREVQEAGAAFNYPLTALLSSGLTLRYKRSKESDEDRTDHRYEVGGNLAYRLSPKLTSRLDLRYRKRDSTDDIDEYSEMSAFVSLVYGFGQVSRPGRRGGGF